MVLTVGIVSDLIRRCVPMGKIMAGSVMAAAPPVIILRLILMDYYVARLTPGDKRLVPEEFLSRF